MLPLPQKIGPVDLSSSLPTWAVLWFCDLLQMYHCSRNLPREAAFGNFHAQTKFLVWCRLCWCRCGNGWMEESPLASSPQTPSFCSSPLEFGFCFSCWEVFREESALIAESCLGSRNRCFRALGYSMGALGLCCLWAAVNSPGAISSSWDMVLTLHGLMSTHGGESLLGSLG